MHALQAQGLRLTDGYAAYGAFVTRDRPVGLNEWRALLPESSLLQRDLSGFRSGWDYYGGWFPGLYGYGLSGATNGSGSGYLGVGFMLGKRDTLPTLFKQRLRLGVNAAGTEDIYGSWRRSLTGVYDTLISQQTGQAYYLDSTWSEGYWANAYRSRIAIDASYQIQRVSDSRWSWFAGAGFMVGLAYGGQASVQHYTERWKEGAGSGNSTYEWQELTRETYALRASLFAAVYASLGLEYRLGRTSPFWSQMSLYYEIRPMMHLISRPGVPSRFESAGQHLFGLRLNLR